MATNFLSDYYYADIDRLIASLVPPQASVFRFTSAPPTKKYDYFVLVNSLAFDRDIQHTVQSLQRFCHPHTRIIVIYVNFLWQPLIRFTSPVRAHNWLSEADIKHLFYLAGYDHITSGRRLLLPLNLGPISTLINRYLARLPVINNFCLTTYQVFRPNPQPKPASVSIVIPAFNEAGNMPRVIDKLPRFAPKIEVIFVVRPSPDGTLEAVKQEIKRTARHPIKSSLYIQTGRGKGDAVRLGFSHAHHDVLMILDADLTVDPSALPKFYQALVTGRGEFINGSRLVYPMQHQAMRTLNYVGNKLFGLLFSYLLGQHIKDTLCGTKVLFKRDYLQIAANRKYFGDFDPFGDFDLLFGAARLNLKIIDLPIYYKQRTYGTTNINRFRHGLLLLKMTAFAALKLKFIP